MTAILSNGRFHLSAERIPGGFRFRLDGAYVPAQPELVIRGTKIPATEAEPAVTVLIEATQADVDADAIDFGVAHPFTSEEILVNLNQVPA